MKYILVITFFVLFFYNSQLKSNVEIEDFDDNIVLFKRYLYSNQSEVKEILEKLDYFSKTDTTSIFRLKYQLSKFEYELTYGEIESSKNSLKVLLDNLKLYEDNIKGYYYNSIAHIYASYKMYDLNEQFHRKVINLPKIKRNDKEYIYALTGLSNVYREKNELDSAKYFVLEAMQLLKTYDDPVLYGTTLQFLSNIYFTKFDPDSALYFIEKFENPNYENNSKYLSSYYNSVAYYHFLKNNLDSAIFFSKKCLQQRYIFNDHVLRLSGLNNLGEMFLANEQYDSAKYYLELARDSLNVTKKMYLMYLNANNLERLYRETNDTINLQLNQLKRIELDSINKVQIDKINLIVKLYETSENLQESTLKNIEYENYIFILVLLTLIITIFIIFTIYYSLRLKEVLKHQDALILDKIETLKQLEIEVDNKNKLISILSHDLINPINSSAQLLAILKAEYNEMSKEEIYEIIIELSKASTNTFDLLKDILNWMKVSTTKIYNYSPKPAKIYHLVQNVYEHIYLQLENKEQKLINTLDRDLTLNIDSILFSTVIRNLFTNASKYSDKGKKIKIYSKEINENFIICIEDEGFGMSEQMLNIVNSGKFESMSKYNKSENSFGYGLLICRDFINIHNGQIKFESKLNEGTTVCLIFNNKIKC
jgi:signal transduction histidine kinase